MSGNPDAMNGAPYRRSRCSSWSCSARITERRQHLRDIRRAAVGIERQYGDNVSPFVRFGLPTSGAPISSRRTPQPASIPWTGPTRSNSTQAATVMCRPVRRWTRRRASRSASPSARSTYDDEGQRRSQRSHGQQRVRHGVRCGRRQAAAGLRLRRFRAIRFRLSPLPGRATHDQCSRTSCARSGGTRSPSAV